MKKQRNARRRKNLNFAMATYLPLIFQRTVSCRGVHFQQIFGCPISFTLLMKLTLVLKHRQDQRHVAKTNTWLKSWNFEKSCLKWLITFSNAFKTHWDKWGRFTYHFQTLFLRTHCSLCPWTWTSSSSFEIVNFSWKD